MLIVAGYTLALGFSLKTIFVDVLKQNNPVGFLNGLLFYFFLTGFVMRYFLQSLPVLDAQPYLHLPIARSRIVHFLLGRSLVHIANVFIFLLFTPFAMTVIAKAYGVSHAWVWLLSVWLISLLNHFVITLFKKKLDDNIWGLITLIAVFGTLSAADYFGWFKLSSVSQTFFDATLVGYTTIAVLVLLVLSCYVITYRFFLHGMYPEELSAQQGQSFHSANWAFLQNFGLTGEWIGVEIKLIVRHKRTRQLLFMNLIFLFYGLIFYNNPKFQTSFGMPLFLGIFITGIFAINYGQFLYSWQAGHFDFTLTQPISLTQFVESKYWLLASFTVLNFLLNIPYVYFGWNILMIHLAGALFNMGVNIFILMNMAMWEPKKIDLSRSGMFNHQGVGAAQWLMSIPILISPFVFYLPLSLLGYPEGGILAVGTAGLIGIIFRKKLIEFTVRRLSEKRLLIAANFRKD